MPRAFTAVFGEPDDFLAALSEEGVVEFLVAGRGQFRARLTQVGLHHLRLSAGEEHLPRVALIAVPTDVILVSLTRGCGPAPIWGGITIAAGEIMTLGAGQRLHMRVDGPCRWGWIWSPVAELVQYGSALTGAAFPIASGARRWRPRAAMMRHLRHLHSAAIGLIESRSRAVIDSASAHGLEQQLIHALVECLSNGSAIEATCATREHRDVAARFEALLQTQPERAFRTAEICKTLGVPPRTLRISCKEQLGIGPTEYDRRRRMQLVHRALRSGNPDVASISAVARRYGFRGLGRFAANFRALFGELPSATLRRSSGRGMARLTLHRVPRRI